MTLGGKLLKVDLPWYEIETGYSATVAGWGFTSSANVMSTRLTKISVTILNEINCMVKNGWSTADRLCAYQPKGTICGVKN